MSKLLIKNANIINPMGDYKGIGDVMIVDGCIEGISKSIASDDAIVIDATGKSLMPGFVDIHAHLREPGYEGKETIATGTRAAAAGGFTTVACMPNTLPLADEPSVIEFIRNKAAIDGVVRVLPIGCISKGQLSERLTDMGALKAAGAIALSDDGRPVTNSHIMHMAMKYAKNFDILLISHCEDLELVNDGVMNEGYWSTLLGLKPITRSSEDVMIAREVSFAETLNTKVHIAHVSTKGGVEIVRDAKRRGVDVTAETCPHYFSATDEMADGFNTFAKVNPPLRAKEDVEAIKQGLKDGTLDCLATDHAPHKFDDKNVEFNMAANGISGFETAFSLAYTNLIKQGVLSMDDLVVRMSYNPAKRLGVEGGVLTVGVQADITIVDENASYVIDAQKFESKGKNTPFDKMQVYGKVTHTVVGGEVIVCDGKVQV